MPALEIRHRTGMVETRELSKEIPLLVGRLASSDIRVEADGVAPVHCRISWKRKNFEVAAVAPEGVQFNGTTVRQHLLSPGDVIRVGDVDIVLLAESRERAANSLKSPSDSQSSGPLPIGPLFDDATDEPANSLASQYELQPLSEESLPVRAFHLGSQFVQDAAKEKPPAGAAPPVEARRPPDGERRAGMQRVAQVILDLDQLADEERQAPAIDPEERVGPPLTRAAGKVRQTLSLPRVRPGERDPLRSPLVLGLLAGSLLLLLSAATLWFILAREKAQREYDQAKSLLLNGQYPQAIEGFELFLRDYPRHALAPQARVDIGTARVEQAIGGGSPAWDKGLEALEAYLKEHVNSKAFADPESPLRQFVLLSADRIAAGALETARAMHQRPLLAVSAKAVELLKSYSPVDNRPEERLKELAGLATAAEAAILQRETFDAAVQKMDEALETRQAQGALVEYRRVLDRYRPTDSADFAAAVGYKPLAERLKKACELERELTVRDEQARESNSAPTAGQSPPSLTLARRTRARSDLASVGGAVFALAADTLFGIDTITGEPLWRRVVGFDPPFAPVPVTAGQPAWLFYDARRRELVLAGQRTGEVLWRLPLAARPRGAPRVHEGQVYLATDDNLLEQIDLQAGRSTAQLRFSQRIVGPCSVSNSGERLYVPGHENILYVLTRRPLACEQVVWLGHAPGAIDVAGIMMRSLLLLAENDRQDGCALRVFDTAREDQKPVEVVAHRIHGRVRDVPVLRGKELFVPSFPERMTAFVVAESGDDQTLTLVGEYQVKDAAPAPVYLASGPDGRVWMQSSALRRFEANRKSLLPSKQELATGIATQPLQASGESLYLGRRLPYSRAVVFAEADRQQMLVQWQVSLGGEILECNQPSGQDASVICVTSQGDLFQVTSQKLARGGFDLQPFGQLPIPEGLTETLSAVRLSDGRLAVHCAGEQPRLWLPAGDGLPHEHKLAEALQANPVRLAGGLLLALPGRLRLSARPAGEPPAEDLPAPIGQDAPPRWIGLAGIDETHAIAVSEQGRVARIQFGTAPVPHLEEITHWDAGSPVDLPPALAAGKLFLIDSTSRLVMLEAGSLDPLAQAVLEASAAARPRPAGELVLVELKTGQLIACDIAGNLAKKWEVALDGATLTGDPLASEGQLLVALSDGRVLWIETATGQVTKTLDLGQELGFGPRKWGEAIVVGTLDGTIVVVNGINAPDKGN